MHNNVVFDARIGDRRITADFKGMNLERQRDALKAIVDAFFADLDEEIGIVEEIKEEKKNNIIESVKMEPKEVVAIEDIENKAAEIQAVNADAEEPQEEPPTKSGFTMADLVKGYAGPAEHSGINADTYASYPEELQQAIQAGVNERNFKLLDNGNVYFQAYYMCTGCSHKGKRFIPKNRKSLTCHDCNKRMLVRPAVDKEFPHNDNYGNMFIAGSFMRRTELHDLGFQQEMKKQEKVYMS